MKTTKWFVGLMVVGIVLCCCAAKAQGNVSFTPMTGSEYTNYANGPYVGGYALLNCGSGIQLNVNGNQTNASLALNLAYSSLFNLSVSNGTVIFSGQIVDGAGNPTPSQASVTLNSLQPIYGVAVRTYNPYPPDDWMSVSNELIGSSYRQLVTDTSSTSFGGMLEMFENSSSSWSAQWIVNNNLANQYSETEFLFLTANPVPEPNTVALAGMGMIMLLAVRRTLKRR